MRKNDARVRIAGRSTRTRRGLLGIAVSSVAALALASCYDFNNPVDPRNASAKAAPAAWVVVYEEDFSVPAGTEADDPSLGFVVVRMPPEPTSRARVEERTPGSTALQVTDVATGDRLDLYRPISPPIGGRVRLELDIGTGTNPLHTSIALADGPSELFGFRLFPVAPSPSTSAALYYYDDNASPTLVTGVETDQLHRVRVDIDTDAGLFDVYLDGSVIAPGVSFGSGIATVDRLRILTTDGSYGTTWLDNVRISEMR